MSLTETVMLTARADNEAYVEASAAVRNARYRCRGCDAPVVFKPCRVKVAHFAHFPGSDCACGSVMSAEHLIAQRLLVESCRRRRVHAELEAPIRSLIGDRRADVLVWPEARPSAKIAIEVQSSDITIDLIEARTRSYNVEGIAPLWLRLYDFGKWGDPKRLLGRNTIWIDKHHVRSWERWVYDHLGNHLWFMDASTFQVWRGAFISAHSYREVSTWFGPGGEEESAGGDWREITRWVELELVGPFLLSDVRLRRMSCRGKDKKRRVAATFLPPGEDAAPTEPSVRAVFLPSGPRGHLTSREIQVRAEAEWKPASMETAKENWRRGIADR